MSNATADGRVIELRPTTAQDAGPPPTTDELVERARRGELSAWTLLYRAHYAGVLRHLCSLVGSREQAEDLTQETFARAMVAIASYSHRAAFSTWLHGVALNVARNHWRAGDRAAKGQAQLRMIEATRELQRGAPDRAHQRRLRVEVLFSVLGELSDSLREAFTLRYIDGLTVDETAQRLDIEAGAVRVRAHRARQMVEQRLAQLGWSSAAGGGA